MALGGTEFTEAPLAPLTVLSPGPRLAGTPSKGKEIVESDAWILARW